MVNNMELNYEQLLCVVIAEAGTSKSASISALDEIADHEYEEARNLITEAEEHLTKAHDAHLSILKMEANGELPPLSFLFCHAADLLAAAETAHDIVQPFIRIMEERDNA